MASKEARARSDRTLCSAQRTPNPRDRKFAESSPFTTIAREIARHRAFERLPRVVGQTLGRRGGARSSSRRAPCTERRSRRRRDGRRRQPRDGPRRGPGWSCGRRGRARSSSRRARPWRTCGRLRRERCVRTRVRMLCDARDRRRGDYTSRFVTAMIGRVLCHGKYLPPIISRDSTSGVPDSLNAIRFLEIF